MKLILVLAACLALAVPASAAQAVVAEAPVADLKLSCPGKDPSYTGACAAPDCGPNEPDYDGDRVCDRLDPDDDNDGYPDSCDPTPYSSSTISDLEAAANCALEDALHVGALRGT